MIESIEDRLRVAQACLEWINDNGRDKRPREVDVVMTLYPSNEKDWVEDYSDLINNRIQELQALDSAFLIDSSSFIGRFNVWP